MSKMKYLYFVGFPEKNHLKCDLSLVTEKHNHPIIMGRENLLYFLQYEKIPLQFEDQEGFNSFTDAFLEHSDWLQIKHLVEQNLFLIGTKLVTVQDLPRRYLL